MATPWPKIMTKVTVPTGGWDFGWNDGSNQTVTVPAGDYDTPLHLGKELQDQLRDEGGGHTTDTVVISSVGITTLTISGMTGTYWGGTDDAFSTALGFAESESVSGGTLTSSGRHTHTWYPGIISFGATTGAGPESDSGCLVQDQTIRTVAGTGAARLVAPARRSYQRKLRFSPIHRNEIFKNRGECVAEFMDRWSTNTHYWYLDRSDGSVGSYGTQIDPGDSYYETDDDGEYYKVTIKSRPEIEGSGRNVDYFSVSLDFNVEPK